MDGTVRQLADSAMPTFDRFDIAEAWYLWLSHYHTGQWSREYVRLCQLLRYFKPRSDLRYETLSENARAIYDRIVV